MENKIIGFCILVICYGCKIKREKGEQRHAASQSRNNLESSTLWSRFHVQDSNLHYWYFKSDSSFLFYPHEGLLLGQSGTVEYLQQRGSKISDINYWTAYDSVGIMQHKEDSIKNSIWTRYHIRYWFWLLFIPFILFAYFYWKR